MTNETTLLEAIRTYGNWCAMRREALDNWVAYKGGDLTETSRLQSYFDLTTKISEEHFAKLTERLHAIEGDKSCGK